MLSNAEVRLLLSASDQQTAVLGQVTAAVNRYSASIAAISGQARSTQSAIAGLESSIARASSSAASGGAHFGTLALAMGAGQLAANTLIGALSRVGDAAGGLIALSSNLEQTRIALTNMLGSAEKADQFIGQLQDFAENTNFNFASLEDGAKRMLGMGFAAEKVIPLLGDIANAVGAVGGDAGAIDRVILALGQMQAKGKLASEEMNQLAELGIPVWQILADAIGKTKAETIALVQTGQIASQTFIDAFQKFSREKWGDIQAQQAKTFQGAMSNVQDVLGRLGTSAIKPVFDALTAGANRFYDVLKTPVAAQFARDVSASLNDVLTALRPIGDAFQRAFSQLQTGGLTAAIGSLLGDLNNFAQGFFGAGLTLVESLASGLMQGAANAVAAAAEFVASIIASFLVGQSPPPSGPLSQIDQDGRRLVETYVSQFGAADLSPVADVADRIKDALGNKDGLESQARAVAATVDQIGDAMRRLQDESFAEKDAVRQIHDQYDPLEEQLSRQIDKIKDVNDLLERQQDIQRELRGLTLDAAEEKARGDPGKRAQIAGALEQLRFSKDDIRNQIELLSLHNTKHENDKKIAALRGQMAQLDGQELNLKRQQAALTDRNALVEVARQRTLLQHEDLQARITKRQEELNRAQQVMPLEQKLKDATKAEQDLIKPHEDQLKLLQQQTDLLSMQQKQYQDIGRSIAASIAALPKPGAAHAGGGMVGAVAGGGVGGAINKSTEGLGDRLIKSGQEAGQSFLSGFQAKLEGARTGLIGAFIGGALGATAFGPLGLLAGAAFGSNLATALEARIPDIGARIQAALQTASDAIGTIRQVFAGDWAPDPAAIAPFTEAVGELALVVKKAIGGDVAGAFKGLVTLLAPIGAQIQAQLAVWGKAFISWLGPQIPGILAQLADLVKKMGVWIGQQVGPLGVQVLEWGKAFLEWVEPQIPPLLAQLGALATQLFSWIAQQLPTIGAALLAWGRAFVEWVGPQIPLLVTELLKLGTAVLVWAQQALPPLVQALARWAVAFIGWVAPLIPPLLLELGKILVEIGGWVLGTAVPRLIILGLSLGRGLVQGIIEGLGDLVNQLTRSISEAVDDAARRVLNQPPRVPSAPAPASAPVSPSDRGRPTDIPGRDWLPAGRSFLPSGPAVPPLPAAAASGIADQTTSFTTLGPKIEAAKESLRQYSQYLLGLSPSRLMEQDNWWRSVRIAALDAADAVQAYRSQINNLPDNGAVTLSVPGVGGPIQAFPNGGMVAGSGSGHRLIAAQPGEYVLSRETVRGILSGRVGGSPVVTVNLGGVTIQNEADENRLVYKIARAFHSALNLSSDAAPGGLPGNI